MPLAIQTQQLCRKFVTYDKPEGFLASVSGLWNRKYTEKMALEPTTISIDSGQIVGLVGANGAGKTTLLKLLSGLIHPSSGSASVLGYNPSLRQNDYLRRISILLGQKNQLWWDIPALDSFALLTEIYDIDRTESKQRIKDLSQMLDCEHVLKTQLRRLSLGERMKMEMIGALLHKPEVLFLDEPTIGLDIVAQATVRKFLAEYVQNQGPTVILTSHYMDDIAQLSDRLLLISKGGLVYDGTVEGFTEKTDIAQKITFSLKEKLVSDFEVNGQLLKSGEQSFGLSAKTEDLATALTKVLTLPNVHDLKIEEVDFEEVIHTFLQTESRIRKTSHTV